MAFRFAPSALVALVGIAMLVVLSKPAAGEAVGALDASATRVPALAVMTNDDKRAAAVHQVFARDERRGRRRRRRSPGYKFYKPLLRALPRNERRRELKRIVRSEDLTKAEISRRVDKWLSEQDAKTKVAGVAACTPIERALQEIYEIFAQERALMKRLRAIGHENFLADDKSDDAKKLFKQLQVGSIAPRPLEADNHFKDVHNDQSLSWDQTCHRRNEVLAAANEEARDELRGKA